MSKELVISAASHERRVAILEEGQLVEIYIEREKEFALVGSIYKGKVTRVLPGMQSAFVDIGLDGDAFLYVSDVFENLEDYEHGQPHEQHDQPLPVPAMPQGNGATVELLPGESLARASERHEEAHAEEFRPQPPAEHQAVSPADAPGATGQLPGPTEEQRAGEPPASEEGTRAESVEERQPDSNASAPQNFSPRFNPTQNYSRRSGNDRQGQNYGRGGDRGRGRFGRRGGRHRGDRQQGGPGGRNLPPSKYASPQSGEFRGYDNRGGQQPGYDNRRQEGPRSSGASPADLGEETIVLPGESLAKYRDKAAASPAAAPIADQGSRTEPSVGDESSPRPANTPPVATSGSGGVPRRFSGGLPSWLLAEAGTEAPSAEAAPAEAESLRAPAAEQSEPERHHRHNDVDLNEDQVAALAADLVEAKHEEAAAEAEADTVVGGAVFEEEDTEEEAEATEEPQSENASGLSAEEVAELEARRASNGPSGAIAAAVPIGAAATAAVNDSNAGAPAAVTTAATPLHAVRSSSRKCSSPARKSSSRLPRSRSAKKAHALPATSLCPAASWSTCPRFITPAYPAKYFPRKIVRAFAAWSVKPATIIPGASSFEPRPAPPPTTKSAPTSISSVRPGPKSSSAARSARLLPCSTATSTSSSACCAITSAMISPPSGSTAKRSTVKSSIS